MNFDFSDDQKMLKEQVSKFLSDKCGYDVVRRVLESDELYAEDVWKGLVEMGLTGTAIPEEYGGLGLGALELCVVAEELGRVAAPVPFSSSVFLATEAIKLAGSEAQKQKYLPKLAAGEIIGTLAMAEGTNAPSPRTVKASLKGGKLTGTKMPVPDGEIADIAVVLVNTGGSGDKALSLAIVELNGSGISKEQLKTIDPTRGHAALKFDGAAAELMGAEGEGWDLVRRVLDGAAVWTAFEQVGGAETAMWMARDYALERYAFGRQIGSYQAIKHKLADMYVKIELARSNSYYGAMMLNDNGAELIEAAAAARISATQAYIYAAQENIQTHGGIGYTWEANTQFFYRRAKLLALSLGSQLYWRERLVTQLEARNAA
ncbi:acyl-CoA dehydrogenase domain-containing protein [Tepidicaulis marinus]|jgi:alkylation response protein AidB-like acyl-CoA dehydrogenase|uniref:Acyl-CoA dehydrogenase domain-containing protein n=1 Tax=Tepidicaulis marinus TaxID=1333998 RepID=A0A081BAX5_9HYPH|nr:acyl-CoA dehydrogenase family protein [Tepidicaulis marinus]GAK45193.1 acyl-CoA dehydrogenase domain-containing protein [Tepidicaulis marinus]